MTDPAPNLQLTPETAPTLSRADRERQQIQAYMDNLRQRGMLPAAQPAPAEQQRGVVAGALNEVKAPKADPKLYTSWAQYEAWQHDPATLTPAQHDEVCQNGGILVQGRGDGPDLLPCPGCQATARAADLRAKLVAAGVDGRYLDVEWADLEQPAPLDRLAAACRDITSILDDGESLILWSEETGSGKTQAAMLAAKAAIRAGRTAQVVNVARLAVDIRDTYGDKSGAGLKESAARRIMTAPDLLIVDDLGAGETDSASVERRLLFQALDERQTYRRPTIITSNVNPRELASIFGARIIARLSPLTIIHVNHGVNFRVRKNWKGRW